MTSFISAPHLATYAGGDTPNPSALIEKPDDAHHCAFCGVDLSAPLFEGKVAKYQPSAGFNNYSDLAVQRSNYLCPHCKVLADGQKYMLQAKTAVACTNGIYPLSKDVHLQNFFLNPPEPPFVVVYSTAKQAHLYWRTPLSLSKNLFIMRFNNEIATVRRKKVLNVVERSSSALLVVNQLLAERTGLKKPLITLLAADYRDARKKTANNSGQVSTYPIYLAKKADDESLIAEIENHLSELSELINELNPIEVWWLTIIGKMGTTIEQPFTLEPLYTPQHEYQGAK